MPEAADRAFHALASRTRVEVLRALSSVPNLSRPEIVENTGLTPSSVRIALEELERLGYVEVSVPVGERHGRRVTYRAAIDRLRADQTALADYIFA